MNGWPPARENTCLAKNAGIFHTGCSSPIDRCPTIMLFRLLPLVALAAISCLRPHLLAADDDVPELKQAREIYEKEIDFTTRPIRSRYISKLETLKRSPGSRGDARAAIAVQEELDRVKGGSGDAPGPARFAGVWKADYENGVTRRYTIKADGTVHWEDAPGLPAGMNGKITMKGSDAVLELDNLERLTIQGDTLMIEYFNPKSSYPSGQPVMRGKGTRIPAKR